ncbi:hypothetical protein KI387_007996, partial [Taxus chinensis]
MAVIVWRIIRVASQTRKNHRVPPGSTGWPLIGETISFYRAMRSPINPRRFIQDHEHRYGTIFRSNLFGISQIIVSVDPEFNRYVLQNEGRLFEANYPKSLRNLIGKYGLLSVHGELQRKLHATASNLLKHEGLSSGFMDDIQNALLAGIERWQDKRVIHLQEECNK